MSNTSFVKINQTLHGYKEGHSLLAYSIDLPNEVKRILLTLSDMSGQSMQSGFEEYITGYPIKDVNLYALAKTWYAPEMKRPGCVWTHTLLINFADLAKINSYKDIMSMFAKPMENFKTEKYNRPIEYLNKSMNIKNFLSKLSAKYTKNIIHNVYDNDFESTLIPFSNSEYHENLLVNLWIQQYPRLKRNFYFCTGSIIPRKFGERYFDLQIIPFINAEKYSANPKLKLILENDINDIIKQIFPHWVDAIYEELFETSDLSSFLLQFGADVKGDKTTYVTLINAYLLIFQTNINQPLEDIIMFLGKNFKNPKIANNLKMTVLNPQVYNTFDFMPFFDETQLIESICKTEYYNSFDKNKLDLEERIERLCNLDKKSVFALLDKLITFDINNFGEIILEKVASLIESEDIRKLNDEHRKLLLVLIQINKEIIYDKAFWNLEYDLQRENLHYISKFGQTNIDWQKIFNIIIHTNTNISKDLIILQKEKAVLFILNYINSLDDITFKLNKDWVTLLSQYPEYILVWLDENCDKIRSKTLNVIIKLIDPNSNIAYVNNHYQWEKLITKDFENLSFSENMEFKSFMLAIGFNINNSDSLKYMKFSFEDVYEYSMNDQLNFNSWKYLEPHTKSLNFWNDWDKCKKLRIALVDKFIELNLPIKEFSTIFSKQYIAHHIMDNLKLSKKFLPFIYELKKHWI